MYWQAQSFADKLLAEFQQATQAADKAAQQQAYFVLSTYHRRTVGILRSSIQAQKDESLVQSALQNLISLHGALLAMHKLAPQIAPLPLAIDRGDRMALQQALILHLLEQRPEGLAVNTIQEALNQLDLLADLSLETVVAQMQALMAMGYLLENEGLYRRTTRAQSTRSLSAETLKQLVGEPLYDYLAANDFYHLGDIAARHQQFASLFQRLTGFSTFTGERFATAAQIIEASLTPAQESWEHADLIGSPYPRPYQYESYAIFRGYGYQATIIDAPTGSGKTMIGMMCIQDWLGELIPGRSILVIVPTINYQQQWIGELCYKSIGLRLPPEAVFAGTPAQFFRYSKQSNLHPAVLITTYAALAQLGSPIGKGGFDASSVEEFLQGGNIHHVLLDEAHKVVEDLRSVTSDVVRLLVEWLNDGSIENLIGFSGTAAPYRERFEALGLRLVHQVPLDDLVACGFVAPFGEFGTTFSNSARERQIRDLLDRYKEQLRLWFTHLDATRLRSWFTAIPIEQRFTLAHDVLGLYRNHPAPQEALQRRFTQWEASNSPELNLSDSSLVSLIQLAHGWSDAEMSTQAQISPESFEGLCNEINALRQQLAALIYLPNVVARLALPDFARTLDILALRQLPNTPLSITARNERLKTLLATTIAGLYEGLSDWYFRVGEGRVETIKAVIEAERATRPVTGVIVFDRGRHIRWQEGITTPGYEGVAGLFAQMLGDDRFTIVAALSNEMYISSQPENPLPNQIASFIEKSFLQGEISEAIFGITHAGLNLPDLLLTQLRTEFDQLLNQYCLTLGDLRTPRLAEFRRRLLKPYQRFIKKMAKREKDKETRRQGDKENTHLAPRPLPPFDAAQGKLATLIPRLDLRHAQLAELVTIFFDYAAIASDFRNAHLAEIEQVSGARRKFFVVRMPGGRRRPLCYDLVARITDADSLPVNLIIVSNWARTGWNVLKPNLLIDATATRDAVAWQQLRGRAMRALRSWTNDCYRLISLLIHGQALDLLDESKMPADVATILAELSHIQSQSLAMDEALRKLLKEIAPPPLYAKVEQAGIQALSDEEKQQLAYRLLQQRNKVTHIYELVKAFGASQVEYNRQQKRWQRREAIALKHAHELSVHPFDGTKQQGDAHAPLIYAVDPRSDLPAELQAHLQRLLPNCDETIVKGWLVGV